MYILNHFYRFSTHFCAQSAHHNNITKIYSKNILNPVLKVFFSHLLIHGLLRDNCLLSGSRNRCSQKFQEEIFRKQLRVGISVPRIQAMYPLEPAHDKG